MVIVAFSPEISASNDGNTFSVGRTIIWFSSNISDTILTEKIITKNEDIPYETVDEYGKEIDANNSSKNYKVQKKGKVGKKQSIYKVSFPYSSTVS